jgi:formylglycine-generating enzyme required for sulfatase activity
MGLHRDSGWYVSEGHRFPISRVVLLLILTLLLSSCTEREKTPAEPPPEEDSNLSDFTYEPPTPDEIVEDPETGEVYVQGRITVGFDDRATEQQVSALIESFTGRVVGEVARYGLYEVEVPQGTNVDALLERLNGDPLVRFAVRSVLGSPSSPGSDRPKEGLEASRTRLPHDPLSIVDLFQNWSLVRAPQAWETTEGGGDVVVAIMDTGVDLDHPDLASRLYSLSWHPLVYPDANDDCGHGTAVAGIAGAAAGGSPPVGIVGANHRAPIMAVRLITHSCNDGRGFVNALSAASALGALKDFSLLTGTRIVVNMSFGGPLATGLIMSPGVYDALNAGLVLVAGAGNDGKNIIKKDPLLADPTDDRLEYPASFPGVVAVGGVTERDQAYSDSNWGAQVIAAPATWTCVTSANGSYEYYVRGTSFATPVVSGLAAMIWSLMPGAGADDVVNVLLESAGHQFPGADKFGLGRVNMLRAVRLALGQGISPTEDKLPAGVPAVEIVPGDTDLWLYWQPTTQNYDGTPTSDIVGYKVYTFIFEPNEFWPRDFVLHTPTPVQGTSYRVEGLETGREYGVNVVPVDAAGQEAIFTATYADLLHGKPVPTPPSAVGDLEVVNTTETTATLRWTSVGDDGDLGQAEVYDIRYATDPGTDWSRMERVDEEPDPAPSGRQEAFVVQGLSPGTTYYFKMKVRDDAGNWSGVSNVATGTTAGGADVTPPAKVVDLLVTSATSTSLTLEWTAVGDDGSQGTASQYDLRYATQASAPWDQMTQVTGEPSPRPAGQGETFTVPGLSPGTTYYFRLKVGDEAGNWSPESNEASGTTLEEEDTTPPARVSDLAVTSPTTTSLLLTWTAVGDDGLEGTASVYDVRYATSPQMSWESMTPIEGEPEPGASGEQEQFRVGGLQPNTAYYFRMKVGDEAGNWSAESNEASGRTSASEPTELVFVLVPAGTFVMGDSYTGDEFSCEDDHRVTLTHDFWIGQHEVTNGEYVELLQWAYDQGLVHATASKVTDAESGEELLDLDDEDCEIQFDPGSGRFSLRQSPSAWAREAYPNGYDPTDHPVKEVTWYGAAAFCDWLSLRGGLEPAYDHSTWECGPGGNPYLAEGYRLPTEAEWEYAAQYDDEGLYPWGNEHPNCSRANFDDYYGTGEYCVGWTSPVGNYPAGNSSLGIWDMAGNVWEWCNDRWACDLGTQPVTDPAGPISGWNRLIRGGSWYRSWTFVRCAMRSYNDPLNAINHLGFRCARTASP